MRIPALFLLVSSCTNPDVQLPPPAKTAAIVAVRGDPTRDDARTPASVRFAIEVTMPLVDPRIEVIAGGANADELTALAKNKITAALRAREIATTMWMDGETIMAQPTRALPVGRNTLVVLQERKLPLSVELDVETAPLPIGVWVAERSVTYCGAQPAEAIALQPGNVPARVTARGACFDITADRSIASLVLPPTIDPAPIPAAAPAPARPEPPCPESAYALGPICARVDDDRVVLLGGVETPRLILGRFGGSTLAEALPIGARRVVRGFAALEPVTIDVLVRDALGDRRVQQTIVMRPPRRHAVINEVLVRPPSGAASQRFVEIVNDGDGPLDLIGLIFRDGDVEWTLPTTILPRGALALITPASYVDGLAGEPAPPKGIDRIVVDALRPGAPLSLEEEDGTVLSRFPATTSTRTLARVRTAPDAADDAPDTFVYAAPTPGRTNVIPR